MNEDALHAGLLAATLVLCLVAGAKLTRPVPRTAATEVAELKVVTLPLVEVTGRRLAASTVAAAPQVVQLPPVHVTGRRVPPIDGAQFAEVH